MSAAFSQRRLEWLLRARGTDVSTWPETDRHAALELMRRSDPARLSYAEALAREDDVIDTDCAVFCRMQAVLRRSLAPLPVALRAVAVGVLVGCVVAGLYLATAMPTADTEAAADLFNTAQTVSLAALDQ